MTLYDIEKNALFQAFAIECRDIAIHIKADHEPPAPDLPDAWMRCSEFFETAYEILSCFPALFRNILVKHDAHRRDAGCHG